MANSKVKSKTVLEYEKELRRIKQAVSRIEKTGYNVPKNIVPQRPKKITQASVNRLKNITPTVIRSKSSKTASSKQTVNRKRTRQIAKTTTKQTQKTLPQTKPTNIPMRPITNADLEAYFQSKEFLDREALRKKQDEDERRLREETEARDTFNQGNITLQKINELINTARVGHKNSAEHLQRVLFEEINTYKNNAIRNIGEMSQRALENAEIAIHYREASDQHWQAIRNIEEIIRGRMLTAEETYNLSQANDNDTYEDEI